MSAAWMRYRKLNCTEMRLYEEGEDLSKMSVEPGYTPKAGDMVARDPTNHDDQWLVSEEYFLSNYEGLA